MGQKQARSNARTWRSSAVQLVEIHRSPNGAVRVNQLATVAASQAGPVIRAIQASLPTEARLYMVGPEAGKARTVREALAEAARRWQAGDLAGSVQGQLRAASEAGKASRRRAKPAIQASRQPQDHAASQQARELSLGRAEGQHAELILGSGAESGASELS